MKVLVLGANGMIGSAVFRILSEKSGWTVLGAIRDTYVMRFFSSEVHPHLVQCGNLDNTDVLIKLFSDIYPDVVINCAGITKHRPESDDPLIAAPLNSLLPHRLAGLCKLIHARLIHISTDCVFSGEKGHYVETDTPDAKDVYGRSKILGEVNYPHAVTLRTSTIGHELSTKYGLLEWFLSQRDFCSGYERAVFSGLPSVVLAQVIRDVVIPCADLSGVYHVASKPINKFDLLKLIATVYEKSIYINSSDSLVIDRSLDASRFHAATGYVAPDWQQLIQTMYTRR